MVQARARGRGNLKRCPATADLFAFAGKAPAEPPKSAELAAFREELTALRAQLDAIRDRVRAATMRMTSGKVLRPASFRR